jgi:hypothetical protein
MISYFLYKLYMLESEDWELDFKWLEGRHKIKDMLNLEKLPTLEGVLFLIGMQELGRPQSDFSKEEKQDLMHIAVCRLLSYDGYYELDGYDEEGWPHWIQLGVPPVSGLNGQEKLLKEKVLEHNQPLQED